MTVKLEVKSLYKIFGDQPDKAFKLLAKGHDRASIGLVAQIGELSSQVVI